MKYQDGTAPTDFGKMSDEDKEWLEQVMKECVIDEVERMTQIIRILQGEDPVVVFGKETESEGEPHTEKDLGEYKEVLLDELLTRVDQVDNAQTFVKIRGLPVILDQISNSDRPVTRALAAEVLATVVQNNPPCQKAALELNSLEPLQKMLSDDDETCQLRALLGISCLIRGNAYGEATFFSKSNNGFGILLNCLKANSIRMKRKALFLLRFFIGASKPHADTLRQVVGFPTSHLTSFIGHDDVDLKESSLLAISEFCRYGPEFVQAVKKDDVAISEITLAIKNRIQEINKLSGEDAEIASVELDAAKEALTFIS